MSETIDVLRAVARGMLKNRVPDGPDFAYPAIQWIDRVANGADEPPTPTEHAALMAGLRDHPAWGVYYGDRIAGFRAYQTFKWMSYLADAIVAGREEPQIDNDRAEVMGSAVAMAEGGNTLAVAIVQAHKLLIAALEYEIERRASEG